MKWGFEKCIGSESVSIEPEILVQELKRAYSNPEEIADQILVHGAVAKVGCAQYRRGTSRKMVRDWAKILD